MNCKKQKMNDKESSKSEEIHKEKLKGNVSQKDSQEKKRMKNEKCKK